MVVSDMMITAYIGFIFGDFREPNTHFMVMPYLGFGSLRSIKSLANICV